MRRNRDIIIMVEVAGLFLSGTFRSLPVKDPTSATGSLEGCVMFELRQNENREISKKL